ncbi:hypothetical protein AMAG_00864 [Allomyces macrogynus ATCC 38327]|uniref:Uncharacterized protein n=1 Tax=Allomyces macrogynus (strain ATCC 38327) TaxID=578462 RepID=A0A0L0RXQ2_ALLM3|nr:hypothetical protein AMAG_00864 [Allomyces macrogynus ATCC 38327]|eukprot:KNE54920.1 hypothetical protein AMAG_00864 [Allomyces macrogynus ATCC 38327]
MTLPRLSTRPFSAAGVVAVLRRADDGSADVVVTTLSMGKGDDVVVSQDVRRVPVPQHEHGRDNAVINVELPLSHLTPPVHTLLIPPTYVPFLADRVTVLNLAGNSLETLPATLWSLTSLRELNVSHNALSRLSPLVACLAGLVELHINGNQLTEMPSTLAQCTRLAVLDASDNRLTSLPATLLTLPSLRRLWVDNNQFASALAGTTTTTAASSTARATTRIFQPITQPPSLRKLAVQAAAVYLKSHDWHAFCHHCPDYQYPSPRRIARHLVGELRAAAAAEQGAAPDPHHHHAVQRLLTALFSQNPAPKAMHGGLQRSRATDLDLSLLDWDMADEEVDGADHDAGYDLFVRDPNGFEVAERIANCDSSSSDNDVRFAQSVWRRILDRIRAMLAPTEVARQVGSPSTPPPDESAQPATSRHLSIRTHRTDELCKDLPPPTPRSGPMSAASSPTKSDGASPTSWSLATSNPRSPLTPSIPSPPSAFGYFCLFQIMPTPLVLALSVPQDVCASCMAGIYYPPRTTSQSDDTIRFATLQAVLGNFVPLEWHLCSVKCWLKVCQSVWQTRSATIKVRRAAPVPAGAVTATWATAQGAVRSAATDGSRTRAGSL